MDTHERTPRDKCGQPDSGRWCSARSTTGKCMAVDFRVHDTPICGYRMRAAQPATEDAGPHVPPRLPSLEDAAMALVLKIAGPPQGGHVVGDYVDMPADVEVHARGPYGFDCRLRRDTCGWRIRHMSTKPEVQWFHLEMDDVLEKQKSMLRSLGESPR